MRINFSRSIICQQDSPSYQFLGHLGAHITQKETSLPFGKDSMSLSACVYCGKVRKFSLSFAHYEKKYPPPALELHHQQVGVGFLAGGVTAVGGAVEKEELVAVYRELGAFHRAEADVAVGSEAELKG